MRQSCRLVRHFFRITGARLSLGLFQASHSRRHLRGGRHLLEHTFSLFTAAVLDFARMHISYPACRAFTVLTLSANTFLSRKGLLQQKLCREIRAGQRPWRAVGIQYVAERRKTFNTAALSTSQIWKQSVLMARLCKGYPLCRGSKASQLHKEVVSDIV